MVILQRCKNKSKPYINNQKNPESLEKNPESFKIFDQPGGKNPSFIMKKMANKIKGLNIPTVPGIKNK